MRDIFWDDRTESSVYYDNTAVKLLLHALNFVHQNIELADSSRLQNHRHDRPALRERLDGLVIALCAIVLCLSGLVLWILLKDLSSHPVCIRLLIALQLLLPLLLLKSSLVSPSPSSPQACSVDVSLLVKGIAIHVV